MNDAPRQISLEEWDQQETTGTPYPYCGHLGRHLADGNLRLRRLRFDNSQASLRLWNFLLTEEDRLRQHRHAGVHIVGTMKDLGTVPVMVYSFPDCVAFYPDGAWWLPCLMEFSTPMLELAARSGIDDSFCPVRAMIGAYLSQRHFPLPDLNICSTGATCDDMSAIAQRLEHMGFPILWWEIPTRRAPEDGEPAVVLPGGFHATPAQVAFVAGELARVKAGIEDLAGQELTPAMMENGIRASNRIRHLLREIRRLVFTAAVCPLPALEMLVAEMLAIHFCSDRQETQAVLQDLLEEVSQRVRSELGYFGSDAIRVYWVNPVADLRAMNLLEECGGRLCGSDFMFCHALDPIPETLPPLEALARMALADPMVGSASQRAERILREVQSAGAEAVIVSRIPGASHCALEGRFIRDLLDVHGIPSTELEVPPVIDPLIPALRTRIETILSIARIRRT